MMQSYPAEMSRITELLRSNPRGMSVGEIASSLGINRNTAARYLDMLLVAGQVDKRTFGKAKVYFLSQRVPIHAMLNSSSDLVMILNAEGQIIQANDQILSFCRTTREETVGFLLEETRLAIFSHPALMAQINDPEGESRSREVIRLMRGASEHFFRQKIIQTVFDSGGPGVTIILEEITEQIRAEEKLRQSEEMFRTLVSDISDVIWAADEKGAITYISPRAETVCGLSPDEMIGCRFTDFMKDDEKKRFLRTIQPSISTRSAWPLVECSFLKPDGESIAIELSGNPITINDADGHPVLLGYRGAFRNVSERNRAVKHVRQWKEFLTSIVENIPDMVAVEELDDHTLVFFNHAAEEFIGFPREFLAGKKPDRIFPEEFAAFWAETTGEVEATHKSLLAIQQFSRNEDSDPRMLRTKKIPIFSSTGQMRYVLSIITDITDEKVPDVISPDTSGIRRK